ncbi:hypothetical protein JW948_14425 [bacterium]|nr:hypothetical protein [bacterium]
MKDFCVDLADTPDSLASMAEILGAAGVNIEGLCLTSCEGRCVVHFAVEDAGTARQVLKDSGIAVRHESEVFVLHKDELGMTGRPGSFGGICRTFADHDIGIRFGYPAENNRFVFGVDHIGKARGLFGE